MHRLAAPDMQDAGAIVSFCGVCRSENGRLAGLEIEHYPQMAERALNRICLDAAQRWPVMQLHLVHRFGFVETGALIVWLGVAARHRRAAFDAAGFVMDFLKTDAPFWKKSCPLEHQEAPSWVGATDEDQARRDRWQARTDGANNRHAKP